MILRGIDLVSFYKDYFMIYFQVPTNGNYTVLITCDDACEVWLNSVEEEGFGLLPSFQGNLLAYTDKYARPYEWQK